ncbi:MAG: DegT/DnrJ/EryC1/StrS family aminotransferase, partial [Candidatus Sumerlaeia bacterium]|nr:DegT/DnrJ/EryC1/StrS family aminotransferase [Candidatus Sumerlaeia bacterium]
DIEAETFLIDADKIAEKITPRTRAIIVVHLYGQPVNMERVTAVARQYNLLIIEDAAQAVGAEYNGKMVGTLGDVACFSFFPGKNLGALGDAGAIVTNNNQVAEVSRMLINHGRKEKFVHDLAGFNYRLDELQAAMLRVKLPYVNSWNERRRKAVNLYRQFLEHHPDMREVIKFPEEYPGTKSVYHLLVIRAKQRDELRKFLTSNGIETGLHYPIPLHLQPAFQYLGYKEGDLPVTEEIVREIISLPLDPLMTETEIEYVCTKIKEFYKT